MAQPPTGKIVARPMVKRACGCLQEFQHYEVDKYRAQRQAKFQRTRCPTCVALLLERQRQAAPPPKAEAIKQLPCGTQVSLSRRPDGSWAGMLKAGGIEVRGEGATDAGPQSVLGALAQQWVAAGADRQQPDDAPA